MSAWNRTMSVKTKKSGRILKSVLEMEYTGLADYLDTRRQKIKNGLQVAGFGKCST